MCQSLIFDTPLVAASVNCRKYFGGENNLGEIDLRIH